MLFHKPGSLLLLICVALIAASCGAPAQTESEIATAVAQTVLAQNSLTKVSALPTLTPAPALQATATSEPDPTSTPGQAVSNPGCIASAVLVGESPPDDTVFLPGEYFWKTWTFVNTGTCIWDTSYSLVFWSGERMEGLVSYPFSEIIQPNETMDISIYLQAPATEGTATGYWRMKTPWGSDFGAGPLSASFYVQIGVSSKPKYGISRVDFQLVRDPAEGCPANVRYTVYATLTSSGPLEIEYFWDQSDGNESGIKPLEFSQAESLTLQREWMIGRGDSPNPRWIQLILTSPQSQNYEKVTILNNCP
ncbi:MAG TPA: NBR1-Ig-like domain-containing protein [Anaerolineales bacterium]